MSAPDEAASHCRDFVRAHDMDAWLATLLAPARDQPRLFAIWNIAADVQRLPWSVGEPALAMIRLQWWRDQLAAGRGAHPALVLLEDHDAARAELTKFLDAQERLMAGPFGALEEAAEWSRASFLSLMRALAGLEDAPLAEAHGLTFLLRRAPYPRRAGLPLLDGALAEEGGRAILGAAASAALRNAGAGGYSPALLAFSLSRLWVKRLGAGGARLARPSQLRRQIFLLGRHVRGKP